MRFWSDVEARAVDMSYLERLTSLLSLMRTIARTYGRGSKCRLWLAMILVVLLPRLPRALRAPQRLDLVLGGKPFSIWMTDRTGLAAFEEVFIRGEYAVPDMADVCTVVDAGANIGVASVYFCLRYPGVRLFAVEPDADVCAVLKRNLAAFPGASVHQCALSDIDGTIDFHVHPTSSIASSLQSRVPGEKIVPVRSYTLDSFMREQGISAIDLLKFDIEGAEYRLLHAIKDCRVVRQYVGEIHPDLLNVSVEDVTALFDGFSVATEPVGAKRFVLTAVIT